MEEGPYEFEELDNCLLKEWDDTLEIGYGLHIVVF